MEELLNMRNSLVALKDEINCHLSFMVKNYVRWTDYEVQNTEYVRNAVDVFCKIYENIGKEVKNV